MFQSAVGMFGIMTDLATIDVEREVEFEVNNPDTDDKIGLLFHFLDEALFLMSGDYFICKVSRYAADYPLDSQLAARDYCDKNDHCKDSVMWAYTFYN